MHELVDNIVWHALSGAQAGCVLHVMHGNTGARGLYARMGFREYSQSVRVVSQA